ncbi:RNA polymerase sigma factor [Planctomycetaceae bacterium SH139]
MNPLPTNSNSPPDPFTSPAGCAEPESLRDLFDAEESKLLRYAFLLVRRREVAEEIVQEVFLQIHASWANVESPRAWLYRSVRNQAWKHLRKSRRETLSSDQSAGVIALMMESMDSTEDTPDAAFVKLEMVTALRELVQALPEKDQQLIRLKYFDGLKYREISERTGMTISNVGYRLHHIMQQLALRLRPLGVDEAQ